MKHPKIITSPKMPNNAVLITRNPSGPSIPWVHPKQLESYKYTRYATVFGYPQDSCMLSNLEPLDCYDPSEEDTLP